MKKAVLSIIFLMFTSYVFAETTPSLAEQRAQVIKNYVKWLGTGNHKAIAKLFTNNALAVSSSGVADKPQHFYKTLLTETISNPKSILINTFAGQGKADMMTGYFYYSWKNKEKKQVSAKFIDLFIFKKNSPKLRAVYVFSNTFQQDIMKQLG
jgi:hypothetical protein